VIYCNDGVIEEFSRDDNDDDHMTAATYYYYYWWGAGVVICLELAPDLHMAQLMPLPLIVSCSSKIQIGFTFLLLALPGSPGQRAVKRLCVCVQGEAAACAGTVSSSGRVPRRVIHCNDGVIEEFSTDDDDDDEVDARLPVNPVTC